MTTQPWVKLPVPVSVLPLLGAPTSNPDPQPANSAPIPPGFTPEAPGTVFGYLPRGQGDVFALERDPAHVVAPYLVRERLQGRTRLLARLQEYPYSLAPVEENLQAVTRFRPRVLDGEILRGVTHLLPRLGEEGATYLRPTLEEA